MTLYNVCTSVVELVEAANEQAAIDRLHQLLTKAGFEPFVDNDSVPHAFESEPLNPEDWND